MTAVLEGGEWSGAWPGRTLPPGRTRHLFYRRLVEPQGRSGWAKNLVPTGIRSRCGRDLMTVCEPAVSNTCMTYTTAVWTMVDSWWCTEELPETCRFLFQKYIWEISASGWYYYKNKIRKHNCIWVHNKLLLFSSPQRLQVYRSLKANP